jgi:hypothetical protein
MLPNPTWLIKNGYLGLYKATLKYPKLFSHLEQDCEKRLATEEQVVVAERLAKKYGKLPNTGWLEKNGYCGLVTAKRKYPEMFAHIEQVRKVLTTGEHVVIAERLAKRYGKLPNSWWLQKNGYSAIREAKRKYPKLFAHIEQIKRILLTPADHVLVAERLAKKYGKLPNTSWLQKNGYIQLDQVRRKHPELFAHIQRDRKCLTPADHVLVAEKLAKKHGKLPNSWWLQKNGHQALDTAKRKSPELFAHIEQKKLGSGGRLIAA